jgi:hypothetical protein
VARRVVLHGSGTAEIAAYGVADAEASIAKELTATLPGALVDVREVRRTEPQPRIVEIFVVQYKVKLPVEVATDLKEEDARRQAFRSGRAALKGTRFERTAWERADVDPL